MINTYRVEYTTDLGTFVQYVESSSELAAKNHVKELEYPNKCFIHDVWMVKNELTIYQLCRLEGTL